MDEQKTSICKICGRKYIPNKKAGNSHTICNSCRQAYRQKLLKKQALEYKGNKCSICGYAKNEAALEFHHIDPTEKDFQISKRYNYSWNKIKDELDKCILLCANCHREVHNKNNKTLEEYQKWITPQKELDKKYKEHQTKKQNTITYIANKYNTDIDTLNKSHFFARKKDRPIYEDFCKSLEECNNNYSAMGRKYNVSSTAIKKWEKSYKRFGF